ncbi:MAG: DegT/DnrJ/EryC1/StrS family aminotransferase [Actinomycetota bacterium]|nr:DegT/DnrJ/EryC1/StrS family aminotransferase [Actinomycetota bacterium]
MDSIPLVDIRLQTEEVAAEVREGFARVFEQSSFIFGDDVAAFEKDFAAFCGVRHCVGVGNGTDAVELALRAAGVTAGDEVLVPANSFVASAAAVVRTGATPVLVDVDPATLLFDADDAASRVGPRTRAVMPVHLYGQMAPMEAVRELAASAGASVVADAAQAHGASQAGAPMAKFGDASATSFYPGKNLGAFGDGGAVLTDSDDLAGKLRSLRNHGSQVKYEHPTVGFNSRLDTLQAVVLTAKLRRLAMWNEARCRAAELYGVLLDGVEEATRPTSAPGNVHVWHLYVVQVPHRDRVLAHMNAHGIGAGIHYLAPIHLHGAFRFLGYGPGDFPVSEAAADRILSLPIYPGISAAQQERVVGILVDALRG